MNPAIHRMTLDEAEKRLNPHPEGEPQTYWRCGFLRVSHGCMTEEQRKWYIEGKLANLKFVYYGGCND